MNIKRLYPGYNDSYFIFGPRGTGKSTWIRENLPQAYIINLLDDTTYLEYLVHPDRIKNVVKANPTIKQFVVDEIQKVPKMLDSIHDLIETYKTHQFILTGSSARKLRREGINLLGGRALLTHFYPFIAAELKEHFDLDAALIYGMIPLIVASKDPLKKMAGYINLYLKEEIQAEGLVRNIETFATFLEVMSFSHGNVLNLNNIARECHTSRKIVENYLSIIEDLLIGYQIPVFTKRAKRAMTSQSKFYYFDVGVYNYLRPKGPLDSHDEVNGAGLEGLVLQHLKACSDYSEKPFKCYFWRTKGGAEVDFVVYGETVFYAIEIKNSRTIHSTDLRSLKTFKEDYPESTVILLYRGNEKLDLEGIVCWPVGDFLVKLSPDHWPE